MEGEIGRSVSGCSLPPPFSGATGGPSSSLSVSSSSDEIGGGWPNSYVRMCEYVCVDTRRTAESILLPVPLSPI